MKSINTKILQKMEKKKYKIAPGVSKSIYPLEYDRNNPMSGFNRWSEHIRKENLKNTYKGSYFRISFNVTLLAEIRECKQAMLEDLVVQEALKIINK